MCMRQCEKSRNFSFFPFFGFHLCAFIGLKSNETAAYYRKYADVNESSLIHENTKSTTEYM